jgi:hypothetical protein
VRPRRRPPPHPHGAQGPARIVCCRKGHTAASRCAERSQFLAPLEDQIAAHLATFRLLEETVPRVIGLDERASRERDGAEARRRELTGRLQHICRSCEWGDKPEAE